ncbi:MAG: glycosyltransferase family 9 protein [Candidatus Eisenbacteria bacterium]|nr:glycosyltransferase family 9 protein [Candidatus Eisenbacteria bacterium]
MPDRAMETPARNVVVFRTDRIGDLILSTPLFEAIKIASPETRVTLVAPPYALPAVEENPHLDETIPWDIKGWAEVRPFAARLRRERFDAAVLLNPGWYDGWAAVIAGIPFRTGPLARPAGFALLNRGVRQARSRSRLHQSELDAAFAKTITGRTRKGTPRPRIWLRDEERRRGGALLLGSGMNASPPRVGIHAGSGGSAVLWPERHYAALGRLFTREGWNVALTGGPGEEERVARLAAEIGDRAFPLAGTADLRVFFGMLTHLDLFIAPSTGPLHAAAALGVPVAAPYSPLPSQSAGRWGPRADRAVVLTPDVDCPERIRCAGERCPHHPCMERIEPERFFEEAAALARRGRESR